jgi:hypothetical protein
MGSLMIEGAVARILMHKQKDKRRNDGGREWWRGVFGWGKGRKKRRRRKKIKTNKQEPFAKTLATNTHTYTHTHTQRERERETHTRNRTLPSPSLPTHTIIYTPHMTLVSQSHRCW